jgi:hypothetical protein
MIALVCLNQKVAYKAVLQGWPLVKKSFPGYRKHYLVVELNSEEKLLKHRVRPHKIIYLLLCLHAGIFEEAAVIVTFHVICEILHNHTFLYLVKEVLVHRDVPEIILY